MQNRLLYSTLFSLFCLPVITSAQQYQPLTPQEQQRRQQQQQQQQFAMQQQDAPVGYHPPVQYFPGQPLAPYGQSYLQHPYAHQQPQAQYLHQQNLPSALNPQLQAIQQQLSTLIVQSQQPQVQNYPYQKQPQLIQQPQVPSEEEQAHSILQQALALLAQSQKTQAQYLHQQNPPSALNPQLQAIQQQLSALLAQSHPQQPLVPVQDITHAPSASLIGMTTVAGSLATQSPLPQLHSPARGNTFKPSGEVKIFFEQNYTNFPILIAVIEDGDSTVMIPLHQFVPERIKIGQTVNFYQVKKNTEGGFFKINVTNKLLLNNQNNYFNVITFAQDLINNNPNALQYWQQINEDVYQSQKQTSQLNPDLPEFKPTQGQVQQQQNSTNRDNKTDRKIEQIGRFIEKNGQKLPKKPQHSVPVRSIEQKATNNIDGEILDLKKTKDNLVKKINSSTHSNGEKFEPFHYLKTYSETEKKAIKERLIGDIERLEESLKIITKQKDAELEQLKKENAELKAAKAIRQRALAEQEKRRQEAEEERQQREAQIAQENSNKKKEQLEQICNNQKPQTPPGIIVLPEQQQQVKKQEEEQKKQQEKQKAPNQSPTHPTRTQTQQERISLVTIMKEQEEEKTEAEKRKKQESGQQLQEKNNTNPQKQNFAAAVSNTNKKRQEEEDQKLAQKLQEEENKKQKEQERLEQQNQRNLHIAEQRAHAPKNVRTSIDEKKRAEELKKREQERRKQQAQHDKALAEQLKKENQEQEQQKREEQAKKDKAKAAQKAAQQTTGKATGQNTKKKKKKEAEKTEEELLAEIKKEWEIRDQEEEQKRKEKERKEGAIEIGNRVLNQIEREIWTKNPSELNARLQRITLSPDQKENNEFMKRFKGVQAVVNYRMSPTDDTLKKELEESISEDYRKILNAILKPDHHSLLIHHEKETPFENLLLGCGAIRIIKTLLDKPEEVKNNLNRLLLPGNNIISRFDIFTHLADLLPQANNLNAQLFISEFNNHKNGIQQYLQNKPEVFEQLALKFKNKEEELRAEQSEKDKAKAAQKAAQQTTGKNTKKNKKETEKTEEELLAELKKEWEIRDQEKEQKEKEQIRKEETTKAPQSQAQPERQIYVIDISCGNVDKIMEDFKKEYPNISAGKIKIIAEKIKAKILRAATSRGTLNTLSINI